MKKDLSTGNNGGGINNVHFQSTDGEMTLSETTSSKRSKGKDCKPKDLLLARKFVRRPKGSKRKTVYGQVFEKAANLWALPKRLSTLYSDSPWRDM